MQSPPKFFHDLSMGEPFLSSRGLTLCNCKLSEKLDPCFEFFVMGDAHNNEVALSVRGQVNGLVVFMA
jgi:hypothetical protein